MSNRLTDLSTRNRKKLRHLNSQGINTCQSNSLLVSTPETARHVSYCVRGRHGTATKNFFVDCDIELISDLKTFAAKLLSLDLIYHISARISPPNPLFSPLWAPLEQYLRERNTDRMTIIEDAPESEKLKTNLPVLVEQASEQTEDTQFIPGEEIPIGDAAILMAADGYGSGHIRGKKNNELVVLKTSETALNFSFSKEPDPYELYLKALQIFERIRTNRHMEHGQ